VSRKAVLLLQRMGQWTS